MEVLTFSEIDKMNENQAMNYLLVKIRNFWRIAKWKYDLEDVDEIVKAFEKLRHYPSVSVLKNEIEKIKKKGGEFYADNG